MSVCMLPVTVAQLSFEDSETVPIVMSAFAAVIGDKLAVSIKLEYCIASACDSCCIHWPPFGLRVKSRVCLLR